MILSIKNFGAYIPECRRLFEAIRVGLHACTVVNLPRLLTPQGFKESDFRLTYIPIYIPMDTRTIAMLNRGDLDASKRIPRITHLRSVNFERAKT